MADTRLTRKKLEAVYDSVSQKYLQAIVRGDQEKCRRYEYAYLLLDALLNGNQIPD